MTNINETKLAELMEIEGYDSLTEFFDEIAYDSTSPGICMHPGCDYTTTVEPDQDQGWCESCSSQTVKSALILGDIL